MSWQVWQCWPKGKWLYSTHRSRWAARRRAGFLMAGRTPGAPVRYTVRAARDAGFLTCPP